MATPRVRVGDRYEFASSHFYGKNGVYRYHYRIVIEITAVDADIAEWEAVEVLEESGRPSWEKQDLLALTGAVATVAIDDPRLGYRRAE